MKKRNQPIFTVLASLLLLAALAVPALAAPFTLNMPVTVELKGAKPAKPETFSIQLEALTPDAPMPADTVNGVFTMDIQEAGTENLPELVFSHPMRALYRIRQNPGTARYYTYDPASYQMEVIVTNTPQGLTPEVVLSKTGQSEKAEKLLFTNSYKPPAPRISDSGNPKMGDEFPMAFWITTGTASLLGAILLTVLTVRRKKET